MEWKRSVQNRSEGTPVRTRWTIEGNPLPSRIGTIRSAPRDTGLDCPRISSKACPPRRSASKSTGSPIRTTRSRTVGMPNGRSFPFAFDVDAPYRFGHIGLGSQRLLGFIQKSFDPYFQRFDLVDLHVIHSGCAFLARTLPMLLQHTYLRRLTNGLAYRSTLCCAHQGWYKPCR
jgi:hypothetical protein